MSEQVEVVVEGERYMMTIYEVVERINELGEICDQLEQCAERRLNSLVVQGAVNDELKRKIAELEAKIAVLEAK